MSDSEETQEETHEETKTCNKCGVARSLDQYTTNRRYKDSLAPTCRVCAKEKYRIKAEAKGVFGNPYRKQVTPFVLIEGEECKRCYKCEKYKPLVNFSKSSHKVDKYAAECKPCASKMHSEYNETHKEERKARDENNKHEINLRDKTRYETDAKFRQSKLDSSKKYYQNNKEARNARIRQRKLEDPIFKLMCNLNSSFHAFFDGYTKTGHMRDYIGLSLDAFDKYIEKQFDERMNWSNNKANGWHVDHIVPCAYFRKLAEKEGMKDCYIKRLWNYKNLRPLWGSENIAKGDTLTEDSIAILKILEKEFPDDGVMYDHSDEKDVENEESLIRDEELEKELYGIIHSDIDELEATEVKDTVIKRKSMRPKISENYSLNEN